MEYSLKYIDEHKQYAIIRNGRPVIWFDFTDYEEAATALLMLNHPEQDHAYSAVQDHT